MSEEENQDVLQDQDESTEKSEDTILGADVEDSASSTEEIPLNAEFPQDKLSSPLDENLSTTPNQSEENDNILKVLQLSVVAGGHSRDYECFLPSESGCDSTLEGATGGIETSDNAVRELNRQGSVLDRSGLNAGKLDVFQKYFGGDGLQFKKYFDDDGLQFQTLPERHNAGRQQNRSDECFPELDQKPSNENPLRHLQIQEPEPELLLNQAGAIVGTVSSRSSRFPESRNDDPLAGFGSVSEAEHSIGSAETIPIGDIYTGNFSPVGPSSEISSRGISSGSSFPSFSSRPQTSSDFNDPQISPRRNKGHRINLKRTSPVSTDSDSLSAERPPLRRRRAAVAKPIVIPKRSDSALASSEGSYSDEPKMENGRKKLTCAFNNNSGTEKDTLTSTGELSSLSKESSVDIDAHVNRRLPPTDSEDETSIYPESTTESDDCQPIPDITSNAFEMLQAVVAAEMVAAEHEQRLESEESECEQEPVSVLSCSPKSSRSLERDEESQGK